ncbi:MAG: Ger(x)C family spore germination protein [Bacillota bacterium]
MNRAGRIAGAGRMAASLWILLLPLLTGCWDRVEINDLALVTAAGLDKGNGNTIKLSLQLAVPAAMPGATGGGEGMGSSGSGGGKPTIVAAAEGVTIPDAMSKLQEKLPRRIFWGNNRVIVIGEDLAREGIVPHVDFFARFPRNRLHAFVFVSKGDAEQVLAHIPPIERNAAEAMRELAEFRFGKRTTLKDLLQKLHTEQQTVIVPWIEETAVDGNQDRGTLLRLNGAAIFKGGKMIGYADDRLMRGILWVRDEIETATITAKVDRDGYISMQQLKAHTTMRPSIHNGKWKLTLDIITDDDVVHNASTLDPDDPKVAKMLENKTEEIINIRVREALDLAQKQLKADIFGFGEAFRRAYPKEWQAAKTRWNEIFPTVEVTVRVKASVRRAGLTNVPPAIPESEVKKK